MAFSITELRAKARGSLHAGLSMPATLKPSEGGEHNITVRRNLANAAMGLKDDYVQLVRATDQVIFLSSELINLGVYLSRNDVVAIHDLAVTYKLDAMDIDDGVTQTWSVTKYGN